MFSALNMWIFISLNFGVLSGIPIICGTPIILAVWVLLWLMAGGFVGVSILFNVGFVSYDIKYDLLYIGFFIFCIGLYVYSL